MNPNIHKLYSIANKPERTIIGLMSGTSLDGLDIALCQFSNSGIHTKIILVNFLTVEYSQDIKNEIHKIFPGKKFIEIEQLCLLNSWLGNLHGQFILDTLKIWNILPETIDIIASHGQTIYHAPISLHNRLEKYSNSTLQIGDGDHIAVKTGIITISDFRQKHVAVGGEGAPLAIYMDHLLYQSIDETRILLNIGGIANFTYLPKKTMQEVELEYFSTDCGPGNTLIDTFVQKYFPGQNFDFNGQIARSGIINEALVLQMKAAKFFSRPFPKTTGQEYFNINFVENCQIKSKTLDICPKNLIASLTRFTVETIAEAIQRCCNSEEACEEGTRIFVYISGGGSHNKTLTEDLSICLGRDKYKIGNLEKLNPKVNGDAKEAVLFALLANEALCGQGYDIRGQCKPNCEENCSRVNVGSNRNRSLLKNISLGKISFPC